MLINLYVFAAEAAEKEGASDGPGGGRPPPARRRRQTEDAVCTNTECKFDRIVRL